MKALWNDIVPKVGVVSGKVEVAPAGMGLCLCCYEIVTVE